LIHKVDSYCKSVNTLVELWSLTPRVIKTLSIFLNSQMVWMEVNRRVMTLSEQE